MVAWPWRPRQRNHVDFKFRLRELLRVGRPSDNNVGGVSNGSLVRDIFRFMFDVFSMRARQIVFAARLKAGERGASVMDVEDLLLGLMLEDQGEPMENLISKLHDGLGAPFSMAQSHSSFFPEEKAKNLAIRIAALTPQMQPIGISTELPLSSALKQIFDSAKDFQTQLHHDQIEPLHLLAASVVAEPSQCAKLLQEHGITQKMVLDQLGVRPRIKTRLATAQRLLVPSVAPEERLRLPLRPRGRIGRFEE